MRAMRRGNRRQVSSALLGVLLLAGCSAGPPAGHGPDTRSTPPRATPSAATTPAPPDVDVSTRPQQRARPRAQTPQGMWWGVDSYVPISAQSIANVRDWYRGRPRPQFWGRYLTGHAAVSRVELAYARAQRIHVLLIVPDANCSGCEGGDYCGGDRTAAQVNEDVSATVRAARRLRVPAGAVLFKDVEQVSSCHGEPTADYLHAWYLGLRATAYRTGFYGNVRKQYYDFPTAYCTVVARDPEFRDSVELDMNEDEPLIGAPRGATGPANAPRFAPRSPRCAPRDATVAWQYGESLDDDNLTDVDQARPDVHGLLDPTGGVT